MKKIFSYPTWMSHPASRRSSALAGALVALAVPAVITGCGSGGGGGDPEPSPSVGADQTVISGRIVDVYAGGAGVSGATVQFAGATARTGSNGSFSLTVARNTPSGNATITAPSGTTLYPYTSITAPAFSCANALRFIVVGPFTGASYSVGTVSVYSRTATSTPNPPCL